MEWKDLLSELVQFVTGIAPELWRIAYRQAITQAVINACVCSLFTFVAAYLGVLAKRLWREYMEEDGYGSDKGMFVVYLWAGVVGTIGVALISGLSAIAYFINPDYYAIKILLDLIK